MTEDETGPSSSCVWNPRVFADDARGTMPRRPQARLRRQIAVGAQGLPAGSLPPPSEPRQCPRMPQLTGSAPPRAAG